MGLVRFVNIKLCKVEDFDMPITYEIPHRMGGAQFQGLNVFLKEGRKQDRNSKRQPASVYKDAPERLLVKAYWPQWKNFHIGGKEIDCPSIMW